MAATITSAGNATVGGSNPANILGAASSESAGTWLLVLLAVSNQGTNGSASCFTDITQSAGGGSVVITPRPDIIFDPGAAGDGAELIVVTIEIVSAITNGQFQANWSTTPSQGVSQVWRITPGAGETISFVAADTTGSTGNATTHSAPTVSVENGDIIFGVAAIETDDAITGDSDTTNGNWSTVITRLHDAGQDASAMSCSSQHKTVNATGNQSWACTSSTARDSARTYIIMRSATTGTSGTGAQTLKKLAQSGSGGETFTGTSAQSLKRLAQSATGVEHPKGTAAQTLNNIDQAGSGAERFTGTSAQTLNNIEQAGTGSERFLGTSAQTLNGIEQAATGIEHPRGSGSQTLNGIDQQASGAETFTGTGAQTLPSIDQSASGVEHPRGSGAQTLPSVDQAGIGAERFTATAAQTLGNIEQAASGAQTNPTTGTSAQTLPSIDQSGAGAERFISAGAQSLPNVEQSASGREIFTGTSAQSLPNVEQQGSGAERFSGTGTQRLPSIDQAGSGRETISGTGAQELPSIRQAASGTAGDTDTSTCDFDITEGADTCEFRARIRASTSSRRLEAFSPPERRMRAELDATEQGDTAHFEAIIVPRATLDIRELADGAFMNADTVTPSVLVMHEMPDGFAVEAFCESWEEHDLEIMQLP